MPKLNRRQIESIKQLHRYGIWIQDLLSVIFDLRPAIRFSKPRIDIKTALEELGLKSESLFYEPVLRETYFIGKDPALLKRGIFLDKQKDKNERNDLLGEILGYPPCCIKFFNENRVKSEPLPIQAKKASKNPNKLDYRLNFIFDFDTRLVREELIKLQENGYRLWNFAMIPHLPCSFDCRPSVKYADRITELFEEYFPEHLKHLQVYLSSPLLFFDNCRFIIFDGESDGKTIFYKKCHGLQTLVPKKTIALLSAGDILKTSPKGLSVFKGKKEIGRITEKAEIFNFCA